ncbi:unnamed protein product [Vitrella brassicaformis CCMP3155]|uniref:Uncharacterized protein n=1 Tax=Vitrella brassicaformis (strain CCMP3155) TaxID=1169540 RepID=A0A0G4H201_VITBC|nr:unnamed protein product [Vitrella brassicaformis CCMP3155]|eukprot:CEM37652.1 unnamed protein product [Vitrella brassicaformis CCMP3155]
MPVPPPLPPPGANAPSVLSLGAHAGALQAFYPHPRYRYPPPHTKMDVDIGHLSVQKASGDSEEERKAAEELRASKRRPRKNRSKKKKSDGEEEWKPGCETKDKRKSGRGQKRNHPTDDNVLDSLDDGRAVQLSKRVRRRPQDREASTISQADSRPPPPSHKQPPAPKTPKTKAKPKPKAKPKAKPKKKPAKKEKEEAAPAQREDAGMMDFNPTRFFFHNSRRERADDTAHHAYWSARFGVDSDSDSEPDELEHQHKEKAPECSSEGGHEVERPGNTTWTEAEVCRDADDGMIDYSDSSLILSTMGGMGLGMGCGLPGDEEGDNDLPPTWWEQGIGIPMPEELPGDSEAIWPDPLSFMDE